MISESEILDDIKKLNGYSILNPAYRYYLNKVTTVIREEFDKGNLTDKSQETLMGYVIEIKNKVNFANYYRVFTEYKTYSRYGNNILNRVSIEDLLLTRNFCESMLFLGESDNIVKISTDKVAKSCTDKLMARCEELMKDKSNNDLYLDIDMLGKNLYNCRQRNDLVDYAKKNSEIFINWQRELVEYNKEFCYLPEALTSSMKELSTFSKSHTRHPDDYREYYMSKLGVELLINLFRMDSNYVEVRDNIIDSVKGIGFSEPIENVTRIELSRFIKDYGEYTDLHSVIRNGIYRRLEYLSYFPANLLSDTFYFCDEFCSSFSKIPLLRYILEYCDIVVKSSEKMFDSDSVFNNALNIQLQALTDYKIITVDERDKVFNNYRRGKK